MKKVIMILGICLTTSVYAQDKPQQVTVTVPELTDFWEGCKEYVLGPVVQNLVDKKVKEMPIGDLSSILEDKINVIMGDFIKMGTKAKENALKHARKEDIAPYHFAMAELFHMVRPAEATVRGMYPKMTKLFDQLNKLYPDQYTQLDYIIDEKLFMDTENAVNETFSEPSAIIPAETEQAKVEAPKVEPVAKEPEALKAPAEKATWW